MFKIGDTSGLCEAHCDEKKHTIKVVGDVIEKLAKKCEDVPKKMRAPAKVIEVTNGCFSSAQGSRSQLQYHYQPSSVRNNRRRQRQ